ncbi:MAG: hypothetical protein DMG64_19350 [Acidobacteria bacterium]|nr:MAG: hypothetical protein DMG64_19350 [Acidobacteriota bacterium]PYY22153.1 MAG: hypothetical protein DMG62_14925 [Acidobacteriota bacterium]
MVLALIAMHWTLQGMVWLVGFLLELILAIAIFRFRLHKEFPLFSCYLVLELVRSIMLAAIGPHHPPYFYAYWITECFVSIFGFFVVEEVFRKAFERRLGLQKLGTVLFRYSLLALVVASVAVAAMAPGGDADKLVAAILVLKRAQSFVRMGLVFCLFIFVFLLGLPWGNHVIGIAIGFTVYGAVELAATAARSYYGSVANGTVVWSIMSVDLCQKLIWIAYFIRKPGPRSVESVHEKDHFPVVAAEVSKMNQAVESFLGR